MFKTILLAYSLLIATAHAGSNLKVSVENRWIESWSQYEKMLSIQATDDVILKDIKVNRGNCNIRKNRLPSLLPYKMKYGEYQRLYVKPCEVIEAEITTDSGVWTFEFK